MTTAKAIGRIDHAQNMSFMHTTDQIRNRTKTLTRRLGWKKVKPGQILNACVKCMGLRLGEKIERLCQIRVVSVRREPLNKLMHNKKYGKSEAVKEGFPELDGPKFVDMFCEAMKPRDGCFAIVTRIEFEYLE